MNIISNIIDIIGEQIFFGEVVVNDENIETIKKIGPENPDLPYLLPGFIDAHVHIESSMLMPAEFARIAVRHGTVGVVTDPHEIANVMGIEGVEFFIKNSKTVPFNFCFGAPSCVPATSFETAGATINSGQIEKLLQNPDIGYLSEMMNYPGVLFNDPEVMAKIEFAKTAGKPIDGHAPGLTGPDAIKYINAGITTDHECFTYEEAKFKLENGMKVIIREGSAAKNFNALWPLIEAFPDMIMFCSDDKHPDDLLQGHINNLVVRALDHEVDLFKVLKAACINPISHYNLDIGFLETGQSADFILVENMDDFKTIATYIKGKLVATNGKENFSAQNSKVINHFEATSMRPEDFRVHSSEKKDVHVIVAREGELITDREKATLTPIDGRLHSDVDRDILKIAVVNRYSEARCAIGFIKGFQLKKGAIASCVAHDSHNIVVVGVDDDSICVAVNAIIAEKGGICCTSEEHVKILPLPIAGIISDKPAEEVATLYTEIDSFAKVYLGSTLSAPFMTLSFMALLVIPSLKMSDLGLFDGTSFTFVD